MKFTFNPLAWMGFSPVPDAKDLAALGATVDVPIYFNNTKKRIEFDTGVDMPALSVGYVYDNVLVNAATGTKFILSASKPGVRFIPLFAVVMTNAYDTVSNAAYVISIRDTSGVMFWLTSAGTDNAVGKYLLLQRSDLYNTLASGTAYDLTNEILVQIENSSVGTTNKKTVCLIGFHL